MERRPSKLAGFTLLEILIVVSVMGMLASATMVTSMHSYKRSQVRSDVNLISSLLRHKRTLAITQSCADTVCLSIQNHGVFIHPHAVTLFEGNTYIARKIEEDELFPLGGLETVSASGEIVFEGGSGDVITPQTITVPNEQGLGWIIEVNTAGGISVFVATP